MTETALPTSRIWRCENTWRDKEFPATVTNALRQKKLQSSSDGKVLGLKVIRGREKVEGDITHSIVTKLEIVK